MLRRPCSNCDIDIGAELTLVYMIHLGLASFCRNGCRRHHQVSRLALQANWPSMHSFNYMQHSSRHVTGKSPPVLELFINVL